MHRRRLALLLAVATSLTALIAPTEAGAETTRESVVACSVVGTGLKPSGEIITTGYKCFDNDRAALDHAASIQRSLDPSKARAVAGPTVTYWDGNTPGSGHRLYVFYTCGSGYLNFDGFAIGGGPATWRNRASSVNTTCSYVSFYYSPNLIGSHVNRTNGQSLVGTGLNNNSASSGIAYG
jgi:hypothetical protein